MAAFREFISISDVLILVRLQTLSRKTDDDDFKDNYKVTIWGFV